MPDQKVLCPECKHLVRPEHFPCAKLKSRLEKKEINTRGNTVERGSGFMATRYKYDFGMCRHGSGWIQYDTDQDESYFGVWVHPEKMQTFTYAEGDTILVTCESLDSYKAELENMSEFYGPPPPAFKVVSLKGQVTQYFDARPE